MTSPFTNSVHLSKCFTSLCLCLLLRTVRITAASLFVELLGGLCEMLLQAKHLVQRLITGDAQSTALLFLFVPCPYPSLNAGTVLSIELAEARLWPKPSDSRGQWRKFENAQDSY